MNVPFKTFILDFVFCNEAVLPALLPVGPSHSPAPNRGSEPTAIGLRSSVWNSHAFKGDMARAIPQHSGGGLAVWRRHDEHGGGGFLLGCLYHLAIQIIVGKKQQNVHICERSDCYWFTTWFGNLLGGGGGPLWLPEEGAKGISGFYSSLFFLSVFLAVVSC